MRLSDGGLPQPLSSDPAGDLGDCFGSSMGDLGDVKDGNWRRRRGNRPPCALLLRGPRAVPDCVDSPVKPVRLPTARFLREAKLELAFAVVVVADALPLDGSAKFAGFRS